jgi:Raf kinase inhibitor-like YbhB/YbcL family protein
MWKCAMAAAALGAALSTGSEGASAMELSSPDIRPGATLSQAQIYSECGGGNVSPALNWSGAPAATQSFALTVFDPDAQGGWWHWIVYDIPAAARGLAQGANSPAGALLGRNDFGHERYDGACPPQGSGAHHYEFKIWALATPSLPADLAAKGETIGPYLAAHALASATLIATYER